MHTAKQSLMKLPEVKSAEAAKEFEAVFLSQMFSHMFEGLDVNPTFGGGAGERMFRGMLVQEYAKNMAHQKGVGIADQLQKMMIQMQEKGGKP
jgi:Rod binding domain-containing protein